MASAARIELASSRICRQLPISRDENKNLLKTVLCLLFAVYTFRCLIHLDDVLM